MRGWKNIFHAKGKQKKAGERILISDKIDLKIKKVTRDKEGHYIMVKGSIQEEDTTIVNIKAPNISSVQFSSAAQSCLTICDPMDCSTLGFSVRHQLPELTQTHVHQIGDVIQPPHTLSSPSPPAFNLS